MLDLNNLKKTDFYYDLPQELIAQTPLEPRNSSRMLCLSKESESQAAKEENENKERDLVLEEIQAKKDPVNSHTGA